MQDQVLPLNEKKPHKNKKKDKQNLFSFNLPADGLMENRDYMKNEMLKIYPKGDLTKTKHDRNFRTNTPKGFHRDKLDSRRSDMYTKVKAVPRAPFIPSNVPKYNANHSEIVSSASGDDVEVDTQQSNSEYGYDGGQSSGKTSEWV